MPLNSQIAFALTLLFGLTAAAQAEVNSGPAIGSSIEPLKVFVVAGDGAGEELDFAARRQGQPTLFVFIPADTWDRPVARFLSTLDKELAKDRPNVAVVAVWLTGDVEKTKDYLPLVQQSLRLSQTALAVYAGDKNGPPAWGINPAAHLTAIIAENDRVVATFGFRSLNETNVPGVLEKLSKAP